MPIYEHHRKVQAYAVRPGDIAYIPWSGRTVEVYEVRRAVWINPDRVPIATVIASVYRCDGRTGDMVLNDNARWRETDTIYVVGDQRDVIAFEHPSPRYLRYSFPVHVTRHRFGTAADGWRLRRGSWVLRTREKVSA